MGGLEACLRALSLPAHSLGAPAHTTHTATRRPISGRAPTPRPWYNRRRWGLWLAGRARLRPPSGRAGQLSAAAARRPARLASLAGAGSLAPSAAAPRRSPLRCRAAIRSHACAVAPGAPLCPSSGEHVARPLQSAARARGTRFFRWLRASHAADRPTRATPRWTCPAQRAARSPRPRDAGSLPLARSVSARGALSA